MLEVSPWIQREFQFELPKAMFPNVTERVRGGPARAEDTVKGIPADILTRRLNGAWSIQENIGHLVDIEALFSGRLDDLEEGLPQLRAWEQTNRATWNADHNFNSINTLLADFRSKRLRLVGRLDSLDASLIERAAHHPRLNKPMRIIDLALFIAEHDDYHLARIAELKREFSSGAAATNWLLP